MSDLERRLEEDRAVRDAARQLLNADLNLARGTARDPGLAKRAADEVADTSLMLVDRALAYARANPALVKGGAAAVLLLLFRHTIFDFIARMFATAEDEDSGEVDEAPEPPEHAGTP